MTPVTVTVRGDIARVTIDNPPVNALGQAVRAGLLAAVREISAHAEVRAVVLACAGRSFVAGADIRELGRPLEPFLPEVLAAIEASPVPWVAALHGTALGGGLELALACHGRVADPATRLGLPEVTLGILPGSGGTVRLPRVVPMAEAIALATSGRPVGAAAALRMGLVDQVAGGDLAEAAENLARTLATSGRPVATLGRAVIGAGDVDWEAERVALARRARGNPGPEEALASLRDAATLPAGAALARERERFLRLSAGPAAAALRHVFFAERAAGRSLRSVAAAPADLSRVGVIGGGTMGAGIAAALLLGGSAVRLIERDAAAADAAGARVAATLAESLRRGAIAAEAEAAARARLSTGADYEALADCGLVIEAVFEDIAVKRAVFDRLDAVMPAEAILATNTSYLDVDRIAGATRDPARVLGLHFFSPAHVMKLLEVVRGQATGARALATGAALARRLGKIAVVAGVCDGFIGNRIMAAYRADCERMLAEGAWPADIDRAMRSFGFAMGLFEVQDMSGLDIAWARRKAQAALCPPAPDVPRIADGLCELGRFGRKAGRGWYDYATGRAEPDPAVAEIIRAESERLGLGRRPFADGEIMARILSVMQREGRAILAEGIAESADDIDVVMITGFGFPRVTGGPMYRMAHAPA